MPYKNKDLIAMNTYQTCTLNFLHSLKPPPKEKLSKWADNYGYIPTGASDYIGSWRTEFLPYMREPMDALTDPCVHEMTIMGPTQGAKSSILLQYLAYTIVRDPGPFIWIHPTGEAAERFSKERIEPLFREMPCLQGKVTESKSRTSGNTILHKTYYGGRFRLASAGSPAALAQSPERYIVLDDVSNFPLSVGAQGNPFGIIEKRSRTFRNRKIIRLGTPTIEGECWATYYYEKSDQRKYYVPCPSCGHKQILEFERLKWDVLVGPSDEIQYKVWYDCEGCSDKIRHDQKLWMIKNGEWRATKPGRKARGYWFNALYLPWTSWEELIAEWLDAQGDPEKIKEFVNLQLGKTWKRLAEAPPDWEELLKRRENYSGRALPSNKIQKITMGVDVQLDRFIYVIIGWGADFEAWVLSEGEEPEWEDLEKVLASSWIAPDGHKKKIDLALIDSGYRTEEIYEWVFKHAPNHVRAIKGERQWSSLFSPSRIERGAKTGKLIKRYLLWHLDTYRLKSKLYRLLNKKPSQGGYFHFGSEVDERFVRELTSERLEERKLPGGRHVFEWVQTGQNHRHDATLYALAGAYMVGVKYLAPEPEIEISDNGGERKEGISPSDKKESLPEKKSNPSKQGGFVRGFLRRR
jgi:phage terminase large subunit GpA-like protein